MMKRYRPHFEEVGISELSEALYEHQETITIDGKVLDIGMHLDADTRARRRLTPNIVTAKLHTARGDLTVPIQKGTAYERMKFTNNLKGRIICYEVRVIRASPKSLAYFLGTLSTLATPERYDVDAWYSAAKTAELLERIRA